MDVAAVEAEVVPVGEEPNHHPGQQKSVSEAFDVSNSTISLESENESDDPSQPKLARVRALVTKKTKAAVPEGDVEVVNALVKDGEGRVPEPEDAPNLTVADVMPQGEKDHVDRNADMLVNIRDDKTLSTLFFYKNTISSRPIVSPRACPSPPRKFLGPSSTLLSSTPSPSTWTGVVS